MKRCTQCGKQFDDGNKFCTFCGGNLEDINKKLFCVNCGKKINAGSKFCDFCGTKINANCFDNAVRPKGTRSYFPKLFSNIPLNLLNKKVLAIIMALLIVISCGIWNFFNNSIEGMWLAEWHVADEIMAITMQITKEKELTDSRKLMNIKLRMSRYAQYPDARFYFNLGKFDNLGNFIVKDGKSFTSRNKSDEEFEYNSKDGTISLKIPLMNVTFRKYSEKDFQNIKAKAKAKVQYRLKGKAEFLPEKENRKYLL